MKTGYWHDRLARLLGIRTITIADGERGLLYRDRQFVRVLKPGVTRLFGHHAPLDLRLCAVSSLAYAGRDAEWLIETLGDALARDFIVVEAAADEVLLLSVEGRVIDALAPGTRRLYWKTGARLTVERLSPRVSPLVPDDITAQLGRIGRLDDMAQGFDVPQGATGQVFADGRLLHRHGPGRHAYWKAAERLRFRVMLPRQQRAEHPEPAAERKAA